MQRSLYTRQGSLFFSLALTLACWLGSLLSAQAAPQVLKDHVPRITKRLKSMKRLESSRQLNLSIGLPLSHRENLTNLLKDLYQPANPHFRHYLSADEFASAFGPSQEDYQAVMAFAQAHDLTVRHTHPNRALLDVSGSVADIEKAFHVHMLVYRHPTEERNFYAPDVEPSLDLDTPVLAISGLDNYVRPHPKPFESLTPVQPEIRPLGGGGSGGGGGGGGSGSGGTYLGLDFRDAYVAGVTLVGNGQSVGLFELTGYNSQDISDYEGEAGLPNVALTNILVDGSDGNDTNYQYAIEATGDIEMAVSMAPGLNSVLVYEGPTPLDVAPLDTNYVQSDSTTADINDVLNRMATDNLAKQLSCSYEMSVNVSTVQIFQQFAAQGQSFFQGSGDTGAYAGAIDEPADDPYLTVVGGTTLSTTGSAHAWSGEVVWLTPASIDPLFGDSPEEASGGGTSLTYPMPTWQQGISMTANQGSTTMRNLPDVTLVANNIDLVWGNDLLGSSLDFTTAGTSLSTPLWAAFMALVNEQAAANGQPPVGFANPALYAIGKSVNYNSCFHDITSGNNYTAGSPAKYKATAGYDLCSGWGSMIGSNLIPALLAPPVENLLVTSPLGFTSFGPGGGPFTVAAQTFTLTNIGSTPLTWSLVNTSAWLNVSAASGTLSPGGPAATLTVSLNAAATNFIIGNHSGNVVISNLTAGTGQNRQFDLDVGNGGFETGDFSDWLYFGESDLSFALAADDIDVAGTNALDGEDDSLFVHSGLYGAYLGQFPTDGGLAQIIATTPGERYLVSFWLTSVPYEGLTTPNDFTATWNGATLYTETNTGVFDWTNMQFVVAATGKRSTIGFTFNNVPAAFGLDDISVEPMSPVLQSGGLTGGAMALTWSSMSAYTYQIQSAGNLIHPNWTNVLAPITGTGGVVAASVPGGGASQQYYRVVLLSGP